MRSRGSAGPTPTPTPSSGSRSAPTPTPTPGLMQNMILVTFSLRGLLGYVSRRAVERGGGLPYGTPFYFDN